MDNIFAYYEFTDFFEDTTVSFSGEICYTILNEQHFLIFELTTEEKYNLYVARYKSENEIGKKPPEILELLVENYDKSIPEHRVALRRYIH